MDNTAVDDKRYTNNINKYLDTRQSQCLPCAQVDIGRPRQAILTQPRQRFLSVFHPAVGQVHFSPQTGVAGGSVPKPTHLGCTAWKHHILKLFLCIYNLFISNAKNSMSLQLVH